MVGAADLFAAEAHETFPVDEFEAERRVGASVEEKPRDAGAVVGSLRPLGPRSLQLEHSAALLLVLTPATPTRLTYKSIIRVRLLVLSNFYAPPYTNFIYHHHHHHHHHHYR